MAAPSTVWPPAMALESLTWKHLNDTAVKGGRILPNGLITEQEANRILLPLQGTQVPSLVGELRSRKPRGAAKNKNKFLKKVSVFIAETNTILQSNYPSTRNKLKKKKLSAASNRAGPAFMSTEPRGQHSRRLRVPPSVVGVGASGLAEAGEQPQGPPDAPHQLPQLPSQGHFHTIQAPPQPTLLF